MIEEPYLRGQVKEKIKRIEEIIEGIHEMLDSDESVYQKLGYVEQAMRSLDELL